MPGQKYSNSRKPFLHIVGGNIVQTVDKDTPDARFREYETEDKQKSSKYELVYVDWAGIIRGIEFKDGDFGETCVIEFDDAYLTLNVASRYFQDFACKIFSADLSKEITLHPYDMEIDGKRKSGISMKQDGEKLANYFYDFTNKKALHGFPEVDRNRDLKASYWKVYFIQTAEFLVEKLKTLTFTKHPIKTKNEPIKQVMPPPPEVPEEVEVSIEDLPF